MSKIMKLVKPEHLKNFLEATAKLAALERGGVNNWGDYGISLHELLEEEEVDSFEELAERDLERFENTEVFDEDE